MNDGHCGAPGNLDLPFGPEPDSSICQTQDRPLTCSKQKQACSFLCSRGRTLKTGRDKAVCCGTTWRCFFEGHASAEETDRVRMWVEAQDREARVKRKK